MASAERTYEILLVEDNPGDVRLTEEILKHSTLIKNIHIVHDGEEALDYLFRRPPYKEAMRPDLILLDLNLPKKTGLEVLTVLKNDVILKYIPIIVLTSSDAEHDINSSYRLQANAFVTKPLDYEQYSYVVKYIEKFWFTLATLPNVKV